MYQTTIGAHQHRTPRKQPLPEGVRTLPDWFRDAGYHTANIREFPAGMNVRGAGKTDWNFVTREPLYDGDREQNDFPARARDLKALFQAHQGFLIASPE